MASRACFVQGRRSLQKHFLALAVMHCLCRSLPRVPLFLLLPKLLHRPAFPVYLYLQHGRKGLPRLPGIDDGWHARIHALHDFPDWYGWGGNSNLGSLSLTHGALLSGTLKTGGTFAAGTLTMKRYQLQRLQWSLIYRNLW